MLTQAMKRVRYAKSELEFSKVSSVKDLCGSGELEACQIVRVDGENLLVKCIYLAREFAECNFTESADSLLNIEICLVKYKLYTRYLGVGIVKDEAYSFSRLVKSILVLLSYKRASDAEWLLNELSVSLDAYVPSNLLIAACM